MKTFRKRLFGVALVCILAIGCYTLFGIKDNFISKVFAKETKKKEDPPPLCEEGWFDLKPTFTFNELGKAVYTIQTDRGNFERVSTSKDIGIDTDGLYIVTEDSKAAAKCKVGKDKTEDWVTIESDNNGILSKGHPLKVIINENCMNDDDYDDITNENVVLRFKLISDENKTCVLKSGKQEANIIIDVAFTMNNISDIQTHPYYFKNQWYYSLCTFIRDGTINDDTKKAFKDAFGWTNKNIDNKLSKLLQKRNAALSDENRGSNVQAYYESMLPFCYNNNDDVASNLPETTVAEKIKRAINQADKNVSENSTTNAFDMNNAFDRAFVNSKYKAGGKIDLNGQNSEIACVDKKELKNGQQANHCFDNNSKSDKINLKCDANTTKESRNSNGYNFSNKQSFYTYSSETINATYNYYKTGSNNTTEGATRTNLDNSTQETKEVCTRTCEEAVDVEYGPPVATKAGQCFEYRVKVTSRIKCTSRLAGDDDGNGAVDPGKEGGKPDEELGLCFPTPFCTHVGRKGVVSGAGPNEEFESCVNKCDGGKYTQECSKKCYNEVYGKGTNNLAINYNLRATQLATASTSNTFITGTGENKTMWSVENTDSCTDGNCGHYYVDVANDAIGYYGGFAAWYYVRPKQQAGIEKHFGVDYGYYLDEGIKRKFTSSGSVCSAECYYVPCGKGYYNKSDIDDTIAKNSAEYESKLKKCESIATCQTKTAEFTMSTSYNKETITFPSKGKSSVDSVESADKDLKTQYPTLKNCNKTSGGSSSSSSSGCATDSVLYDYNGCYRTPGNPSDLDDTDTPDSTYRDGDKFYQVEITYPGTWIKNKTQELSYESKEGKKGWTKQNEKFCLPFSAEDVNEDWWKWRMNKEADDKDYSYETFVDENNCSIIDEDALKSKDYDEYSEVKRSSDLKYNIKATVENFGHYGWNFNIRCFYALDDDSTSKKAPKKNTGKGSSNSSKNNLSCERSLNYTVRTVDLNNLFPDKDGSVLSDKQKTGRTPGFNWTNAATISSKKAGNTSYAIRPKKLIKNIQELGDKIFENDDLYLDYSFHLTPEILGKIRDYNESNKSYTTFNGEFLTSDDAIKKYGLVAYRSNLFYHNDAKANNSSVIIGSQYVKALGNIGCNNDADGSNCDLSNAKDE